MAPTLGEGLLTSLVNSRSMAGGTVSDALSWSSSLGTSLPGVESGSVSFAVCTCATFWMLPEFVTVAVICRLVLPPTANAPIVQMPVPLT